MIIQNMGSSIIGAPAVNLSTGVTIYEDFLGPLMGSNLPVGDGYFRWAANNGGYGDGLSTGTGGLGSAGRLGIIRIGTGTTNNGTGQSFLVSDSTSMYAGQAAFVMQWAARVPASLSTAGVEYVMEMGVGLYPFNPSQNACVIQYLRSASTNFSAYTGNNGVYTQVTTADSTNFAVTANTWYNFQIIINAAGTLVSFYVAKIGSPYVLLGTSSTNLPDVADQGYPYFNISKLSSTATNSIMSVDWWSLNAQFATAR